MADYLCITCGTQYPASDSPPASCPICEDDRQYVRQGGQAWTTLADLQADHHNVLTEEEPNLTSIASEPRFAIGQRGLLVQTADMNVLWDCISLIDEDTIQRVKALGGIDAMAVSHPHFYSSMVAWSHAFDAPIYLHADNTPWVMNPDDNIRFWEGETHALGDGLTLIRCGGHFPGAQVLHWADGADGKGALLTADIVNVVADRRHVSFMYSFPNLIPLPAKAIRQITAALEPFAYDRIYGGWAGAVVREDAKAGVAFSAQRYIEAIRD